MSTEDQPIHPPAAAAEPNPAVAAVSIKLPPFWPADPEVWFAQMEAQFTTRHVTSQQTRFEYVISSLSPEFATEVRDLLLRPPPGNSYDTLKAELIRRTAASQQRKLQQLISGEELGDRKLTQLLRRMQQLLGDRPEAGADTNVFLKELFLQRLPANVRMVLASADADMDLHKLADMADKVMEVATPPIASISAPDTSSEVQQLREEVSRLADLVASLNTRNDRRRARIPRNRSPAPRRSRNPSPTTQDDLPATLCWYHKKFGQAARKCQPPCTSGNS